ncbi:MAG TPA: glycosyltransferase family 4 protein [Phycisphaerae bacterium]|nr:glycosyltransferase family 4 protein [Phycisphaerae bacterium]
MKICHLITRLIIGGAQENTLFTCEGLQDRGHEVVLMAGPETGPEGSLWDRVDSSGLAGVKIQSLRRAVHPLQDWRCLRHLTAALRAGRFDVVHTHSSKAGILGRLAARRAGTPLIIHTIHGMSFNRTQPAVVRTFYRALERHAARHTHAFVSVADAMTEQAVAAGLAEPDRFTTIHSGMDTERFTPDEAARARVRAEWGVEPNRVVVGTIARLFRNKGYEEIIAAMPRMVGEADSLSFVWVGDGRDRPRYEQALAQLGLRDRVHLTGLVPPDRIPTLLAGCDILVHASKWEGLPRALPQALLMEVPVVSFDNDGAPEVVTPGVTGELVRLGDVDGLAAAVIRLARRPELRRRMGADGRKRCLQMFDHRLMVSRIESLYHCLRDRTGNC